MVALVQPLSASAVMAFVLSLFALVFSALWWRDRERGIGWYAAGIMLLTLIAATAPAHQSVGAYTQASPWSAVLAARLACLALGLIDDLGVPSAARHRVMAATLLPPVALALLVATIGVTGVLIPRA